VFREFSSIVNFLHLDKFDVFDSENYKLVEIKGRIYKLKPGQVGSVMSDDITEITLELRPKNQSTKDFRIIVEGEESEDTMLESIISEEEWRNIKSIKRTLQKVNNEVITVPVASLTFLLSLVEKLIIVEYEECTAGQALDALKEGDWAQYTDKDDCTVTLTDIPADDMSLFLRDDIQWKKEFNE
jgi:hypothetical protein